MLTNWNQFENQLVAVIDELVPLVEHRNSNISLTWKPEKD